MLSILILTLVPVMTTPKPQPPQPKQPVEFFNKEGLNPTVCEAQEKKKKGSKRLNPEGWREERQKFFTAYTTKGTKVNNRRPMEVRNKEGLVAQDRAKRRMKEKNKKSSVPLS